MKKMANGGLTDQEIVDKLGRLGLKAGTADYALGQKTLRADKTAQELEDLLPSREKIGTALRGRLDPETVADAVNPAGAVARRIAGASKDVQMPRSYADAGGMKKGGSVHAVDQVKKHASGFKHNSEQSSKHAAGFKPHHEHVKAMCGGGMTKGKK